MAALLLMAPLNATDDERNPSMSLLTEIEYLSNNEALSSNADDNQPITNKVRMCASHPDIDSMLRRNGPSYTMPSTHPTVHPLFSKWLGNTC
jgi:hypothetical protein